MRTVFDETVPTKKNQLYAKFCENIKHSATFQSILSNDGSFLNRDGNQEAPVVVKALTITVAHVLLVTVLLGYILLGAVVFWALEANVEEQVVNASNVTSSTEAENAKFMFYEWILFALTVLTTCGYEGITVDTKEGEVAYFIYGMIGIPLMFLTAADLGKFLTEIFIKFCTKCQAKLGQVFAWSQTIHNKSPPSSSPLHLITWTLKTSTHPSMMQFLPIVLDFVVLTLYCCLGSLMFMTGEKNWAFSHYFHFAFNCVSTVALGPVKPHSLLYLVCIGIYCIVGLSLVSMSFEIAAGQMKGAFQKIHYFGRANVLVQELRKKLVKNLGQTKFAVSDKAELIATLEMLELCKAGLVPWAEIEPMMEKNIKPYVPHAVDQFNFIDTPSIPDVDATSSIYTRSATEEITLDNMTTCEGESINFKFADNCELMN